MYFKLYFIITMSTCTLFSMWSKFDLFSQKILFHFFFGEKNEFCFGFPCTKRCVNVLINTSFVNAFKNYYFERLITNIEMTQLLLSCVNYGKKRCKKFYKKHELN